MTCADGRREWIHSRSSLDNYMKTSRAAYAGSRVEAMSIGKLVSGTVRDITDTPSTNLDALGLHAQLN
jgi:hypothetical protein